MKNNEKVKRIDREWILEKLSSKMSCPDRLRYNKKERAYIATWLKSRYDQSNADDYAFAIEMTIPVSQVLYIKQIHRPNYLDRKITIKFKIY